MSDLHCSGQRWVWDAAFTGDSQFVLTGKYDENLSTLNLSLRLLVRR